MIILLEIIAFALIIKRLCKLNKFRYYYKNNK